MPARGCILRTGKGMDFITLAFNLALLFGAGYANIYGGRTGKAGAAILIATTIFWCITARMDAGWVGISFWLLAMDSGCLLVLVILALTSDRYWPIWAMGLQTAAVATHLAALFAPDTMSAIYQALLSVWTLIILWVMVNGTRRDWQYERGSSHASQ